MKKKYNILMIIYSIITAGLSVFFLAYFIFYLLNINKGAYVYVGTSANYRIILYRATVAPLIVFNLVMFLLNAAIFSLLVFLLIHINRNEIKSVSIDFKEKKKVNLQKQCEKQEKKKAELQKKLDDLNNHGDNPPSC